MKVKEFGQYLEKLEKTTRRNEITRILAALFKKASCKEIDKIVYLSLGKLAPPFEAIEFTIAEKIMIKAIALAFGFSESAVLAEFKQSGDLGQTALKLRQKKKISLTKILTVDKLYQKLFSIAQDSGTGSQERKIKSMAQLIYETDSVFIKYLVRIPIGKLRLGFSSMTVLDALSWMKKKDKSLRPQIEAAYCVVADIGRIAKIFKAKGIAGLKRIKAETGIPILPARAERLPSAEKIIEKLGLCAVEPKIDGFRAQIHIDRDKKSVKIFSRNLENTTSMFPDIVRACYRLLESNKSLKSAILDGEAIGFDPKTGRLLPFQETVQRKRKYDVGEFTLKLPLVVFVFDLLFYNGKTLLGQSFLSRRKILEKLLSEKGKILRLTPQKIVIKPKDLRSELHRAIAQGQEGLMCKKLDSVYQAGARNFNWVKYKKTMEDKLIDTIDCLIMGYYKGRGKRASFGIGAFLAGVYHSQKDEFVTIAKIGTGLSDEQWRQLRKRCDELRVEKKPKNYHVEKNLAPDVWCQPKLVAEIKADEITQSPIHTAKLALRFPRLERFRDRQPEDITTTKEVLALFKNEKK